MIQESNYDDLALQPGEDREFKNQITRTEIEWNQIFQKIKLDSKLSIEAEDMIPDKPHLEPIAVWAIASKEKDNNLVGIATEM